MFSKSLISLFLLSSCVQIYGQGLSNDEQYLKNPKSRLGRDKYEDYAFQIKIIDEFIERFNTDKKTLLHRYLEANNADYQLTKLDFYKQLFDKSRQWNIENLRSFFRAINPEEQQIFLSFYDEDWFAELDCDFEYLGKRESIHLVMKVLKTGDNTSRWCIESAFGTCLNRIEIPTPIFPTDSIPERSLSPSSHGVNFVGLEKIFHKKQNYKVLFSNTFLLNHTNVFFQELLDNRLIFKQVNKVKYHFLQVKNWTFTVEKFSRNSVNAGWLITNLLTLTDDEKTIYRQKNLGIFTQKENH